MKVNRFAGVLTICLLALAIYLLTFFTFHRAYSGDGVIIQASSKQRVILITGVSGMIGSHLAEEVLRRSEDNLVIGIDNYSTSLKRNAGRIKKSYGTRFEMLEADVTETVEPWSSLNRLDEIYHLASPASPKNYYKDPIGTYKANTVGTVNMLELASRYNAKILFASTSEVYGDPLEHPQLESYWGNVNPYGPRACYDESKRMGEALCYIYKHTRAVDTKIARIFNTYGPNMHPDDGRVISNFIMQSLRGEPITVNGDGSQTRSFQYVSDLVSGLILLMDSNIDSPVNLGNPHEEYTMMELASMVQKIVGTDTGITHTDLPLDDPKRRKANITTATNRLGWEAKVSIRDGLEKTVDYFRFLYNSIEL